MQGWDTGDQTTHRGNGAMQADAEHSFHGLPWSIIDDIVHGPARLMPVALKACAYVRHQPNRTALVEEVARALKATVINVLDAASQCPTALKVSPDGRRMTLSCAPDPFTMSPREAKEEERRQQIDLKRREAAAARKAKDDEDTPFNGLRRRLETVGMGTDEARKFVGFLLRTYGMKQADAAIAVAEANRPGEPRPYVMSVIKRQVDGRPGGGGQRTARVKAQIAPQPGAQTILIGWEDRERNGVRHRLYRLPSGLIRREPPAPGETAPTTTEDRGTEVSG